MAAPMARRTGVWGIAFAILLLVSSGMVSGPLSNRPLQEITDFYSKNSTVVLIAQFVGVLAAGAFFLFSSNLARTLDYRRVRMIGIVVSIAAVATAVPIVLLALGTAATSTLVRMIDLTDVFLFFVIALFLGDGRRAEIAARLDPADLWFGRHPLCDSGGNGSADGIYDPRCHRAGGVSSSCGPAGDLGPEAVDRLSTEESECCITSPVLVTRVSDIRVPEIGAYPDPTWFSTFVTSWTIRSGRSQITLSIPVPVAVTDRESVESPA